jgi:GPH family glycoside/pentoside/hexuronide:cation symporter
MLGLSVETMNNLRIADIIIPSLTAGLAVWIMWNYSLNEERVSKIKKELQERRAERKMKLNK